MFKYKNILANVSTPNWTEEVFLINNSKRMYRGQILLVMSTFKKFLVRFMKKNCEKQAKQSLELKRLQKRWQIMYQVEKLLYFFEQLD